MREITQINGVYLHNTLFRRPADNALAERAEKNRREKSDDVKPQTQSTTSTVTRSCRRPAAPPTRERSAMIVLPFLPMILPVSSLRQ